MKINLLLCLIGIGLLSSCQDKPVDSPEFMGDEAMANLEPDSIQIQTEKNSYEIPVLRNDTIAVIEGDMVIPIRINPITGKMRGWSIVGKKWSDNTLYYTINAGSPNQADIKKAITHWETNVPGIKFKLKDASTKNYVEFVKGTGPRSDVGMSGNRQEITISDDTKLGNIIHEIGHALGLFHEQSRKDRDTYVTVDTNNVKVEYKKNYRITVGESNGTTYDYGSIMHYPSSSTKFAVDPAKPIITPKKPGAVIGQRNGLSAADISGIKKRYGL